MTRHVFLTGSPIRLHRLRPRDLPADGDLKFSYFRYVDFGGADLSGYDCRFVDVVDSDASGVTLPSESAWLSSQRSVWTGATIPDFPTLDLQHDLVIEVIRRRLAAAPLPLRPALELVRTHVAASYLNSWDDSIWRLNNELGLTGQAIHDVFSTYAFQGYPTLLRRLVNSTAEVAPSRPAITPYVALRVAGSEDVPLSQWPQAMTDAADMHDRWKLAREAETFLGGPAEWVSIFRFITPISDGWAQRVAFVHPDDALMRLVLAFR